MTIELDGPGVTIDEVMAVARRGEPVELTKRAIERMAVARAIVDDLAEDCQPDCGHCGNRVGQRWQCAARPYFAGS